jgi:hypothetical protein
MQIDVLFSTPTDFHLSDAIFRVFPSLLEFVFVDFCYCSVLVFHKMIINKFIKMLRVQMPINNAFLEIFNFEKKKIKACL